jgi:mono/diheme cytochrome c family protein
MEEENMKYKRKFGAIILLLVMVPFLLSGCGGAEAPPPTEVPPEPTATTATPAVPPVTSRQAEQLYKNNCAKCHGVDGLATGSSIASLNLSGVGNMALTTLQEQSDDELFATISGGKGREMPPWQLSLSEDERWEVIAYIRTLAK